MSFAGLRTPGEVEARGGGPHAGTPTQRDGRPQMGPYPPLGWVRGSLLLPDKLLKRMRILADAAARDAEGPGHLAHVQVAAGIQA